MDDKYNSKPEQVNVADLLADNWVEGVRGAKVQLGEGKPAL